MYKPKRHLSQNFLHNRQLVKKLVDYSSIDKNDLVIEIGPGKGIITQILSQKARQVLAYEIDSKLAHDIANNSTQNIAVFQQNALKLTLPLTEYKIFSNLPLAIEGKFIRQILTSTNPPKETTLVVRKRPALRWSGQKYNSLFSSLWLPWFEFQIKHQFKASDFKPQTKVKAVLLIVSKRKKPLLSWCQKESYQQFVKQGFKGGGRISQNLKNSISSNQLNQATQKLSLNFNSMPTQLTFQNWLDLYKIYKEL